MNPLALQIQGEIRREGPITFARYMELALYAPGLGYYERQREIGRRGDFFTSVSVGPLFGELLGFQFAQWMGEGNFDRCQIVEAGAHDGTLAADVLGWMQRWRPDLFSRIEYVLIEPSPARRVWQERTCQAWRSQIKWVSDLAELSPEKTGRIIFCNELLDALPVHRFCWDGQKWEECRVGWDSDRFVWKLAACPDSLAEALPRIEPELAAVMPRGFMVEHSPAAVEWWKKAGEMLGHGKLLTIDYGLTGPEFLLPERSGGTLRTYSKHHVGGGLLDNPGECDITAHVNFSAIEAVGRAAGLATETVIGQDKFLTQILAKIEAVPGQFETWAPTRIKQFQTLTHPDHLGRAFRVLIQSRTGNSFNAAAMGADDLSRE